MLTRLARSTKCIAEETFGDERAYIVVKLTRCDSGLLYKTSKPRVSIVEWYHARLLQTRGHGSESRAHGDWPGGSLRIEKRGGIAKFRDNEERIPPYDIVPEHE
jgi:hypothetical protein